MIRRAAPRRGFTLVEILVVIGIIAILVSIVSVVAIRVIDKARVASAKAEIAQISNAVGAFKAKMNVSYIPSGGGGPNGTFRLRAQYYDAPTGAQVGTSSPEAIYLKSLFPALPPNGTGFSTGITAAQEADLDANQTLVFFLTGGSDLTNFSGFSTNRQNPFETTASSRIGPFVEFSANKYVKGISVNGAAGASSLIDPWGSPYAYFASYPGRSPQTNVQNNYEKNERFTFNGTTVQPYEFGGKYLNLRGFQLISAGENGKDDTDPKGFGAGGVWAPGTGEYTEGGRGADDVSNFNEGTLVTKN